MALLFQPPILVNKVAGELYAELPVLVELADSPDLMGAIRGLAVDGHMKTCRKKEVHGGELASFVLLEARDLLQCHACNP